MDFAMPFLINTICEQSRKVPGYPISVIVAFDARVLG
jgi:hypothetical protein